MRSPVKPTSSCRSFGAPCVTYRSGRPTRRMRGARPESDRVSQTAEPKPAGQHALLDRDQELVLAGQLGGQAGVDRLGEASIGDGHSDPVVGEDVGRLERLGRPRCRSPAGPRGRRCRRRCSASRRISPVPISIRSATGGQRRPRCPRRAGSAAPPVRRRSAARCAACGPASPRRAGPSARCWAGSAGRRCRRRRDGSGRRRRPARRGPSRTPR